MYVFLNKKIAIPNNVHLRTLGWNVEHGFLCCGGDERLLKVSEGCCARSWLRQRWCQQSTSPGR